jgi:acetyltransferase-like isoleucine patch superfamily enzyme
LVQEDVYIHPTSTVDTQQIGESTRVWACAQIMAEVHIGSNCNIGSHCFIESGVTIGSRATIKNGTLICEGVTIEDGVFVGPGVVFTNDCYPRSPRLAAAGSRYDTKEWLLPTVVRRGASIGAGAIIGAGVVIGEFALVGCGAVVARDVSAYAVVLGNPARARGWACQCGQRLRFREEVTCCTNCQRRYITEGSAIRPIEIE